MFTLHVVLTSSPESIFSFIFYNNFTEIKITVFKKTNLAGYYSYACNDAVERSQLLLYLLNISLTTSKTKLTMVKHCVIMLGSEMLTDSLKHFFLTRLNKELDTRDFYLFSSNLRKLRAAFKEEKG